MNVHDLRVAMTDSRFRDVRWFDELDSSNRWLVDATKNAEETAVADGTVVIVGMQTAGRGRLGRTWTAPVGSGLLMSVLLHPLVEMERWPLFGFAMALSLCDAVEQLRSDGKCADHLGMPVVKWPNDVVFNDVSADPPYQKLAGILAETGGQALVVGMGVNVRRPGELPPLTSGAAAPVWLSDIGFVGDPIDVCAVVLKAFGQRCTQMEASPHEFMDAYRALCMTIGASVNVQLGSGDVSGIVVDITNDGQLVLRSGNEDLVLSAGDVTHVRPRA